MADVTWRGNDPGFQKQAVGNYPAKSDVADKDNIYLTDQGWVYRHFKSLDKQKYWDEIIWAGYVDSSVAANDPVDSINDPTPEFLNGDGIQFVSGNYPASSVTIGTIDIGGPDTGDTSAALPFTVNSVAGTLANTDTWKWEAVSTPPGGGVTISNATGNFTGDTPTQANTNITFDTAGQYVVKVTLTSVSGDGLVSEATHGFGAEVHSTDDVIGTVTVSGQTKPQAGNGITYSATYTGDAPEGDVTYTWTATPSGGVQITDPAGGDPNQKKFVFSTQASVTSTVIKCTITDSDASDSGAFGNLTVVPHFVIGTGAVAGGNTTVVKDVATATYSVTFTGTSNPAPNDLVYAWTATGVAGSFNSATSATPTFTPTAAGTATIKCTVTSAKSDPTSAVCTSKALTVTAS